MRLPSIDPLRLSLVASAAAFFLPLYAFGSASESLGSGDDALPAAADVARGARLYDQWWSEVGTSAPSTTHPADAAASSSEAGTTEVGRSTWRCADCHGWDYQGASGPSARGASRAGVGSLLDAAKRPSQALFEAIRGLGTPHDFAASLTPADVWDLVAFVRHGVADTSPSVCGGGFAQGNATTGGPLFTASCATCHGADGKAFELEGGKGLGELAKSDPWRVLHAIRWGVPGTEMPSLWAEGCTDAAQADLLTYVQSLTSGAAVTPPPPPLPATVSFSKDVYPIWKSRGCAGCHRGSAGMILSGDVKASYAQLFATGNRVDRAKPSNSLVLRKPSMSGVVHGGGRIFGCASDPDYQRLLRWIQQGALDN
jgi:thiosulfate dehydrogenase